LTDKAAEVHAPRVITEAAYEAAFLALMDSLTCAFKALQDPACTRLLGALVPGATMAFGARVPGTSYQLDPVQAACNIGTMVGWLDCSDEAFASDCGHLADNLGAILAVADYRSRKAIAEGAKPLTVRDLSAALIRAHEHASLEWVRSIRGACSSHPSQGGRIGAVWTYKNRVSRCRDVTARWHQRSTCNSSRIRSARIERIGGNRPVRRRTRSRAA
jgi:MmgE/PrpD N-terminal domain